MRHLRLLHVLQEFRRQRRELGLFTVEVTSIHETPPLPPASGPSWRDAADVWLAVGAGRRGGVGAAGQVEVDLARHKDWFIVAMSPTTLAPLKTRLRSRRTSPHRPRMLAERIEAGDQADVEDVPVVGFQNAVLRRLAGSFHRFQP